MSGAQVLTPEDVLAEARSIRDEALQASKAAQRSAESSARNADSAFLMCIVALAGAYVVYRYHKEIGAMLMEAGEKVRGGIDA